MLRMEQVYVIRHKVLVDHDSISSVARELGISRNTVSKYLQTSEPVRKPEATRRPWPVTDIIAPRIDEILSEWAGRVTPKQRITGTRIHRQLLKENCQVGITVVRDYLREKRRRSAEVFIPLVHHPGEEGQFDFFDVDVEEGGVFRKAWKLVLRLPYSGRDFVGLYDSCDQLSFLDGHVRAAARFNGLPRRIVYDNLSSAVKRRVGLLPELTERFKALVSHYLFEPCFARPGEGHDKGSVEARGKGLKLQHLTPVPRGKSLAEMSSALISKVEETWRQRVRQDGRRCWDLWQEERVKLLPLPERPFEARKTLLVPVSSKSTVQIGAATYSVPSGWASQKPQRMLASRILSSCAAVRRKCFHAKDVAASASVTAITSRSWRGSPKRCARWRRSWWRNWASPTAGCGLSWWAATAPGRQGGCCPGYWGQWSTTARRRSPKPLRRLWMPDAVTFWP